MPSNPGDMNAPRHFPEHSPSKEAKIIQAGQYSDYQEFDGKFALQYLWRYYHPRRGVLPDEYTVADHLIPFLRARKPGGVCLDPATGPTSHHQIFLAPYFDALHVGDYLADNREQTCKFASRAEDAFPWEHYAQFYLEREQAFTEECSIAARLCETRRKIADNIFATNLMQRPVVNSGMLYDAVGCFYCLEEIASTAQGLFDVVANAASMLRTGGEFMVSAIAYTDFYKIENESGEELTIPCLSISEDLLAEALDAAGLDIPRGGLILKKATENADQELSSIVAVYATKRR